MTLNIVTILFILHGKINTLNSWLVFSASGKSLSNRPDRDIHLHPIVKVWYL